MRCLVRRQFQRWWGSGGARGAESLARLHRMIDQCMDDRGFNAGGRTVVERRAQTQDANDRHVDASRKKRPLQRAEMFHAHRPIETARAEPCVGFDAEPGWHGACRQHREARDYLTPYGRALRKAPVDTAPVKLCRLEQRPKRGATVAFDVTIDEDEPTRSRITSNTTSYSSITRRHPRYQY
jgi:hypothetical protein